MCEALLVGGARWAWALADWDWDWTSTNEFLLAIQWRRTKYVRYGMMKLWVWEIDARIDATMEGEPGTLRNEPDRGGVRRRVKATVQNER